jgi:hypothetical protein
VPQPQVAQSKVEFPTKPPTAVPKAALQVAAYRMPSSAVLTAMEDEWV